MCGIGGQVRFDGRAVDPLLLDRIGEAMRHRGPDAGGIHIDAGTGLVHRRLRIIDLSEAGRQPMTNEDETVWVVFNGEIYNFPDLRCELEEKGHRFRSRTDTEVIVHLYEEHADDLVDRLRGMFAFALWDSRRRRLLLARDRLGKKPLYYRHDGNVLTFASELAGLLADDTIPRRVDPAQIDRFLTFQYVPAPFSILEGVSKLPPAHRAVFDDSGLQLERYWTLRFTPKLTRLDFGAAAEIVREKLREATRLRMISDVPLGAFLSGGVDSSGVVALMACHSERPVKTFSIGFEDLDFSELPYAREVARRYGTDHTEVIVEPDAIAILPRLVRHYGDPFADPSAIPTYYVSEVTRRHVTVALNGDGGDECFAGYERYVASRLIRSLGWVPDPVARGVVSTLDRFGESTSRVSVMRRLKRLFQFLQLGGDRTYFKIMSIFDRPARMELYTSGLKDRLGPTDPWVDFEAALKKSDARDPLDRMTSLDIATYLPEDLLVKVDIASMAHGLEARSPLLDHPLVEFAATLPPAFKISGWHTKRILKKALEPLLPRSILTRSKMGFGVPLGRWFRGSLKEHVTEILLDRRSVDRGYFDRSSLERLLNEHQSGIRDHAHRLYALLMLELWHREFLDRGRAPAEPG